MGGGEVLRGFERWCRKWIERVALAQKPLFVQGVRDTTLLIVLSCQSSVLTGLGLTLLGGGLALLRHCVAAGGRHADDLAGVQVR